MQKEMDNQQSKSVFLDFGKREFGILFFFFWGGEFGMIASVRATDVIIVTK